MFKTANMWLVLPPFQSLANYQCGIMSIQDTAKRDLYFTLESKKTLNSIDLPMALEYRIAIKFMHLYNQLLDKDDHKESIAAI